MSLPGLGDVAPSKDDIGKGRNALSLIGARKSAEALVVLEGVASPNAFTELVKAMALRDLGGSLVEAETAIVAAGSETPGIFRHLMPWRRAEKIGPHIRDEPRLQACISLRLFKRYDLCGWACQAAHLKGFRNLDGTPLLLDLPGADISQTCLIDGERHTALAAHISTHEMSPKAYREFFALGPRPGRQGR